MVCASRRVLNELFAQHRQMLRARDWLRSETPGSAPTGLFASRQLAKDQEPPLLLIDFNMAAACEVLSLKLGDIAIRDLHVFMASAPEAVDTAVVRSLWQAPTAKCRHDLFG